MTWLMSWRFILVKSVYWSCNTRCFWELAESESSSFSARFSFSF